MITSKQRFDIILDMMDTFKGKHDSVNRALSDNGEVEYCKPFETISVADVKEYCWELLTEISEDVV
jgi:hypothetical protein